MTAQSLSIFGRFLALPLIFSAFASCSTPQALKTNGEPEPLLNLLFASKKQVDDEAETKKRLIQIAAAPESQGPIDGEGLEVPEAPLPDNYELVEEGSKPALPGANNDRTVGNNRSQGKPSGPIFLGDIFSNRDGMRLEKTVSIGESMQKRGKSANNDVFGKIAKSETYRVPLTITQDEILQLKQKTMTERTLPTRSVALDFESRKRSATPEDLELLFGKLTAGSGGELGGNQDIEKEVSENLRVAKERLKKGERLYVVTGVTESDKMIADYPGAPVGNRDAEPIKNAVETMFPQLEGVKAEKHGEKIEIRRDPGIYWGFEARELKLENDQIVIEKEESIQY